MIVQASLRPRMQDDPASRVERRSFTTWGALGASSLPSAELLSTVSANNTTANRPSATLCRGDLAQDDAHQRSGDALDHVCDLNQVASADEHREPRSDEVLRRREDTCSDPSSEVASASEQDVARDRGRSLTLRLRPTLRHHSTRQPVKRPTHYPSGQTPEPTDHQVDKNQRSKGRSRSGCKPNTSARTETWTETWT